MKYAYLRRSLHQISNYRQQEEKNTRREPAKGGSERQWEEPAPCFAAMVFLFGGGSMLEAEASFQKATTCQILLGAESDVEHDRLKSRRQQVEASCFRPATKARRKQTEARPGSWNLELGS